MKKQISIVGLFLVIILGLGCWKGDSIFDGITILPDTLTKVYIDFATPQGDQKSMIGFKYGIIGGLPSVEKITPLAPSLWRLSDQIANAYPLLTQINAQPILIMSDLWGYPPPNGMNFKRPYENYTDWESFIGRVAKASVGQNMVFEIWNGPDGSNWDGSSQNFFETFKRAHTIIRRELGQNAMISGPGASKFDTAFIKQFLDYCVVNSIQLDVLSYREVRTTEQLPMIEKGLKYAKDRLLNNPKYGSLKIKKIALNEVVNQSVQLQPGAGLASLYFLEKGGAEGACRSCWTESTGMNNCYIFTLDGLLTPERYDPRAIWWTYYYYAKSLKQRVQTISYNKSVVAFANTQPEQAGTAQVLLGYFMANPDSTKALKLEIHLQNLNKLAFLGGSTQIQVEIRKIPVSGEEPVKLLEAIVPQKIEITENNATIQIDNVKMYEGYILIISKG